MPAPWGWDNHTMNMTPDEITSEIRDIISAATARDDSVGWFYATRYTDEEEARLKVLRGMLAKTENKI